MDSRVDGYENIMRTDHMGVRTQRCDTDRCRMWIDRGRGYRYKGDVPWMLD